MKRKKVKTRCILTRLPVKEFEHVFFYINTQNPYKYSTKTLLSYKKYHFALKWRQLVLVDSV